MSNRGARLDGTLSIATGTPHGRARHLDVLRGSCWGLGYVTDGVFVVG